MEEFLLVGAEQDAVVAVPVHRVEDNASVTTVIVIGGHVVRVELLDVHSPSIDEVVVATFALIFVKVALCAVAVLERGQNCVELHFVF